MTSGNHCAITTDDDIDELAVRVLPSTRDNDVMAISGHIINIDTDTNSVY